MNNIEYSEFWQPIRQGKFGELFSAEPVLIKERWMSKRIPNRDISVYLWLNAKDCYVQLYFNGENRSERREEILALFPESDYTRERKNSPKETKVKFPVLDKGRNNREDWDEIREALVTMGADIYNKINESDL